MALGGQAGLRQAGDDVSGTLLRIDPGSPRENALAEAVAHQKATDEPIWLRVEHGWTEAKFEPGDPVRVPFDDGWGPAEVLEVGESYGERYVRVKYGPGGKYTTSLSPGSIQTTNLHTHPPVLTIKCGEKEWT